MKPKLLLLHGALGAKEQFKNIEPELSPDFDVYSMNFTGHGGEAFPDEAFSIALFAGNVLDFLEENNIGKINIFGYSMGGYVALYLAKYHPDRIEKVFTIATKFNWTEETSAKEARMLDPQKIEEKVPVFAGQLKQRHAPQDWKINLNKTAEMMLNLEKSNELTFDDLASVEHQVRVGVGDRDTMVGLDETINAFRSLKNGELSILPATPHPWEKVKTFRIVPAIKEFFS